MFFKDKSVFRFPRILGWNLWAKASATPLIYTRVLLPTSSYISLAFKTVCFTICKNKIASSLLNTNCDHLCQYLAWKAIISTEGSKWFEKTSQINILTSHVWDLTVSTQLAVKDITFTIPITEYGALYCACVDCNYPYSPAPTHPFSIFTSHSRRRDPISPTISHIPVAPFSYANLPCPLST